MGDLIRQLQPRCHLDLFQHLPHQAAAALQRWDALQAAGSGPAVPNQAAPHAHPMSDQRARLAEALPELQQAIREFVQELKAQQAAQRETQQGEGGVGGQGDGQAADEWLWSDADWEDECDMDVGGTVTKEDLLAAEAFVQQQAPGLGLLPSLGGQGQDWDMGSEGSWQQLEESSEAGAGDWDEQPFDQQGPAVKSDDAGLDIFGSVAGAGVDVDGTVRSKPSQMDAPQPQPLLQSRALGALEPMGSMSCSEEQDRGETEALAYGGNEAAATAPDVTMVDDAAEVMSDEDPTPLGGDMQHPMHARSARQAAAAAHQLSQQQLSAALPEQLAELAQGVVLGLERLAAAVPAAPGTSAKADTAFAHMVAVIRTSWEVVRSAEGSGGRRGPVFVFNDGPVTRAAKLGLPLLLEDFDAPSQAITERLNSLLETEPSLLVAEDPTAACGGAGGAVALLPGLTVFATVRLAHPGARVNLSPAARSRFTEVHVGPYTDDGLRAAVMEELAAELMAGAQDAHGGHAAPTTPAARSRGARLATNAADAAEELVDLMWGVRAARASRPAWVPDQSEVHQLFKWAHFVAGHASEPDPVRRVLVGASYFFLDHLTPVGVRRGVRSCICSWGHAEKLWHFACALACGPCWPESAVR